MTKRILGGIRTLRFLSVLPLALLAGMAHADEPITGAYAGVGVGRATLHRARFTRSDVEAHDTAFKALFGYRAMRRLAFEASYADFGEMAKRDELTGDVEAFSVGIVGLIPLRQVELFGKAGFGAWRGTTVDRNGQSVRDDDIDPLLGLGVQLRNGRFAVRAEIEAQFLSFDAGEHGRDGDLLDLISIGANWRF
ncbi:outer membrane beta-barrel protein [Peristeroidobacter agariperforans]|uniref:outer membrane beta-barrel protein n=1 Tax=Peristeroidobacter agariperforans TaxID=268404 RepID=UPI0013004603|nr:outer membrane beta-barrel protein [Peristeroidobacter agariperforans]